MKKIFYLLSLLIFTTACSSGNSSSTDEELKEDDIVQSINDGIEAEKNALEVEAEETFNEIDSLLSNVEN